MALLLPTAMLFPLVLASGNLLPRQAGLNNLTVTDDFTDWLSSANASDSFPVSLPPLQTERYPGGVLPGGSGMTARWRAWVRVDGATGDVVDTAHVGLYPDPSTEQDRDDITFDDSWIVCPALTRFVNNVPADEDVEENCSNVFSEECISWLNDWARDGRQCLNSTMSNFSEWEENSPCANEDVKVAGTYTPILRPDNVGPALKLTNFSQSRYDASFDEPGNVSYDSLVNSIYLFSIGFAQASNDSGSQGINESAQTVPSRFFCLRPDTFSDGSRTLEEIEDAGVGMTPSMGMALLGAAVASFITFGML